MTFVAVCATQTPRAECLAALHDPHVFIDDVLSVARNAALAACEDEWIAYVDGDVVVSPSWTVPRVADDVAVVSGPLTGDFATHDAGAQTFHGGNVAFRAPALRGVGGFWPARGHRFGRDWFSEEHEAQRELARAGWHSLFDERMAARRLSSPGRLRRAARAGARRQLLGEPRAKRELLTLAMHGRPGLVAEAAGGLLARRLAGRDVEPVAPRTPFRASVPMPAGTASRRRSGGLILLYHRVIDRADDSLGLCVSPEHFTEQVDVLQRDWDVVPLEDAARPGAVAITFDDGYADNLVAAEILGDLPATLFVSTGHVESGRGFWWDDVRRALAASEAPLRLLDRAWPRRSAVEERTLRAWLQGMPPAGIADVLATLRSWAALTPGPLPEDRPMTKTELLSTRFTLGAHTRDHPSLAALDPAEQRAQVGGSAADLTTWSGRAPTAFAYPFGAPGVDFDDVTRNIVRQAGFELAVTTTPGTVTPTSDRLALPRVTAPDAGAMEFARWLRSSAAL